MSNVQQQLVTINSEDAVTLAATVFSPADKHIKAQVLIASATAVKRQYYYKFAHYLAEQGYQVTCFDYRCIGDSLHGHVRQANAQVRDWGEKDLNAVINWLKQRHPQQKIHFVGHSIGGQLVALAKDNQHLDSLLHCSVQSGYWKLWPFLQRFKLFMLWYVLVPVFTKQLGYFPSKKLGVGENMPNGIIREWAAWCRDPQYMFGKHAPKSVQGLKNITAPVRSYSFNGDDLAPKSAVDFIAQQYECEVDRQHINGEAWGKKSIGHFDIFREHMKDNLWPQFVTWLDQHS